MMAAEFQPVRPVRVALGGALRRPRGPPRRCGLAIRTDISKKGLLLTSAAIMGTGTALPSGLSGHLGRMEQGWGPRHRPGVPRLHGVAPAPTPIWIPAQFPSHLGNYSAFRSSCKPTLDFRGFDLNDKSNDPGIICSK